MRKHIVAGNWKMNKNLQEGIALATEINDLLKAEKPNCEVIIGTPFIHLAKVSEVVDHSLVAVSAENCADKASGAYTGEVSAEMVKSTGAEYVILGHSERRELPTNPSGQSVPAKRPRPNRQKRSMPSSASAWLTNSVLPQQTKPRSSTVVRAKPAMHPNSLPSLTSTADSSAVLRSRRLTSRASSMLGKPKCSAELHC